MNKITINVLEAMIQYTRQTFDATCNTISDGMYYKKAKQNQRNETAETTETKPRNLRGNFFEILIQLRWGGGQPREL